MRIEVHINSVLSKAWEIPEDCLQDIDGANWQENVEARQMIIDKYITQFKKFVTPIFDGEPRVMYCISAESKGNELSDEMLEYLVETNLKAFA